MTTLAPPSRTVSSTLRLSEYARLFTFPSGIQRTVWTRVEAKGRDLGLGFDWWQAQLGSVCLGYDESGRYVATVGGIGMSIPRQVGKTYFVLATLVILCVLFPGLQVVWTAHHLRTSTKTFTSLRGMCRRKKIAPHVRAMRSANGEQQVEFMNGSMIMFGARSQGFGRGFDEIDVEVFDEAQILDTKALEDMIAATNQARHPHGALLFFMGTPPRPMDPSDAFRLRRDEAWSGEAEDSIWLELSADPESDPNDASEWPKMNPSYPLRTPHESMLRLRKNLKDDDSWNREGRGVWDLVAVHKAIVSAGKWTMLRVRPEDPMDERALPIEDEPPTALGLDMSHSRSLAISGAWRMDERVHAEVLSLGELDTTSAVEWLRERAGRRIPVIVDAMSPAASMVPALEKAKVKVVVTNSTEMGKACGAWFDLVAESGFSHVGQEQLTAAVAAARKRAIGKAGMWGLDRADESADISPLVSVVMATYGVQAKAKPEQPRRSRVVVMS